MVCSPFHFPDSLYPHGPLASGSARRASRKSVHLPSGSGTLSPEEEVSEIIQNCIKNVIFIRMKKEFRETFHVIYLIRYPRWRFEGEIFARHPPPPPPQPLPNKSWLTMLEKWSLPIRLYKRVYKGFACCPITFICS